MTHHSERTLGLSPAQVIGSALAAMSGALIVSWAGTTGTLIGAAVGSLVATIGAATYTWSLQRTSYAVRRTAAQVRETARTAGPLPRTVARGPLRTEGAASGPMTLDEPLNAKPRSRGLAWGKVLLASAAVMATAVGGITTLEALSGQPLSSLGGRDDARGTSLGSIERTDSDPSPQRTSDPAEESPPATDPPATQSDDPVPSSPTPTEPTDPAETPALPAEEAPAPDPSAGANPTEDSSAP